MNKITWKTVNSVGQFMPILAAFALAVVGVLWWVFSPPYTLFINYLTAVLVLEMFMRYGTFVIAALILVTAILMR
jgi:hypothetical protein